MNRVELAPLPEHQFELPPSPAGEHDRALCLAMAHDGSGSTAAFLCLPEHIEHNEVHKGVLLATMPTAIAQASGEAWAGFHNFAQFIAEHFLRAREVRVGEMQPGPAPREPVQ